jgi:hypothetical protein
MKITNKIKFALISILSVSLFFTSCDSDDDNEINNAVVSEYTGVLVGSTGAYKLNLTKSGASATILFDDKKYNLSTDKPLEPGQSISLTDGSVSLTIAIDNKGENPVISFKIPGHTVSATIHKVTESNDVQVYLGYETDQKSTNGGPFIEREREVYNLSFNNKEFTCLEEGENGIYRIKGVILKSTENELTIQEKRTNNGGNTPLVDLNEEDSKDTILTFKKTGNQLIWSEIDEGSGNTRWKDEIILTKVKF